MEVEFKGLPSHFQTPETCRKHFDNGYCPENIFASLASNQSTIYDPHKPFGLWNNTRNNECYEINFEPAKKSREWSENEARLLNIIFLVRWENGVYKINETQAKNKVEEEFNKDGCFSFRAKLERFSKAETASVRNEIYNQRGTEENYKFPRSIKLDYK